MTLLNHFQSLFKSDAERRLERETERNIKISEATMRIRQQIAHQLRFRDQYLQNARQAARKGFADQVEFLKKAIRKTMATHRRLERQLLILQTAKTIKEQAESSRSFSQAMNAISESIAEVFSVADLARTQGNFQKAMQQASSLEQQMDIFWDMTSESVFSTDGLGEEDLSGITDDELEGLIHEGEPVTREENATPDRDALARDIDQIENELHRNNH